MSLKRARPGFHKPPIGAGVNLRAAPWAKFLQGLWLFRQAHGAVRLYDYSGRGWHGEPDTGTTTDLSGVGTRWGSASEWKNGGALLRYDVGAISLSAPLTISAWVVPGFVNSSSGDQNFAKILSRAMTTTVDPYILYSLGVNNTNPAKFTLDLSTGVSGSQFTLSGSTSLVSGSLYHVVATYTGATATVYVNGRQDGQSSTSLVVGTSSTQNTVLGYYRSDLSAVTGNRWLGSMLEAFTLNGYALSAAEVAQLYRAGLGFWYSGPRRLTAAIPATAASRPWWQYTQPMMGSLGTGGLSGV